MVGVVLPVLVVASHFVFVTGLTALINNLLLYCLRCVLLAKYRTTENKLGLSNYCTASIIKEAASYRDVAAAS